MRPVVRVVLRSKVGSQEGVIPLQHLPLAMLLRRDSCKALRAGVTSRVRWGTQHAMRGDDMWQCMPACP